MHIIQRRVGNRVCLSRTSSIIMEEIRCHFDEKPSVEGSSSFLWDHCVLNWIGCFVPSLFTHALTIHTVYHLATGSPAFRTALSHSFTIPEQLFLDTLVDLPNSYEEFYSKMSTATKQQQNELSFRDVMNKAAASAIRGGTAGAVAMGANVACLMWMRTTVNYQYRNGTSFPVALRTLYADGGIPRFYRGVLPALLQGPLSRFGDTAANTGVLTALDSMEQTRDLPIGVKTVAASMSAALFRIFLMPIDTTKYVRSEWIGLIMSEYNRCYGRSNIA